MCIALVTHLPSQCYVFVHAVKMLLFNCSVSSHSLAARYATQSNHSGIATSQKKTTRSVDTSNLLCASDGRVYLCPIPQAQQNYRKSIIFNRR